MTKTISNRKCAYNRTIKRKHTVSGNIIEKKDGWIILQIYGEPYERGVAHGFLLHKELCQTKKVFKFLLKNDIMVSKPIFMKKSNDLMKPIIQKQYPEFYNEICGISAGAKMAGKNISVDFLIAWNSYISLYYYFKGVAKEKCSAFIATGDATENGDMIMAHTTHSDYASGQLQNIILYVTPINGHSFVMQTSPGFIASATDWFLCSTGIIGCETTISKTNYKPKFGDPYFCRIRQAMQYGETLDEYVDIMSTRNAGDYACSWLLGDTRTNEAMLFEISLNYKNVQKTKNGVFYGMNSAIDNKLRQNDTTDVDHNNAETSSGSRNIRLKYLLNNQYKRKININNAKSIISDQYAADKKPNESNDNGICKHMSKSTAQIGNGLSYIFGSTDAKVVNTEMARKMEFQGIMGSACGHPFIVKSFIKLHPELNEWSDALSDIPLHKWSDIRMK